MAVVDAGDGAIAEALAQGLARHRVDVRQDHPAVVATRGTGRDAELAAGIAKARARAADGVKLFEAYDAKGAEQAFRDAVALFEQNVAGLSSPKDLVDANLALARIFFANQLEAQVREIFRRVVQLDPELTLDRARYPEGLVRIYDSVRTPMVTGPQGKLQVIAKPGPALVYLDGRARGTAPLELQNIAPGSHSLAVLRPGFRPFERTVEVTSFRVDTHIATMEPSRHPAIAKVFDDGGARAKDAAGATLEDYLSAIAEAASLDLVLVTRVEGAGAGRTLDVRAWDREKKALVAIDGVKLPAAEIRVLDEAAAAVLEALASRGAIPSLAARRRVEYGGGALDSSRPWALRAALSSTFGVQSAGRNVPGTPRTGLRVGVERRLGSRVVASAMTGLDGANDRRMTLEDGSGPLAADAGPVGATLLSVPLELSARGYGRVGTWAPFLSGGAGVTWDTIRWSEGLPEDRVESPAGLGFTGFAGAGVDRALDPRSAVHLEARWQVHALGAGDGEVHVTNQPSRKFPVGGETYGGVRVTAGYLRSF